MATIPRQMVGLPSSPSFRYKQLNPAYQSDPRRILGQSLMTQGNSYAPVQTPLQGLGRLSSALVGAYLQKGAMDRQVQKESAYEDKLTNALSGINMADMPAGFEAYSQINPEGALKSSMNISEQRRLTELNKPKVEMVTVHKPDNYLDVKAFPKGSAELIAATQDGSYVAGSPPNAPSGFKYGQNNELIIQPSGSPAFTRAKEFTKEPQSIANKLEVAKQAYKESLVLAEKGDGLSDTALIYKFFTALEPGGRVTDGEARMTNNAASYGQQLSNQLSKAIESRVFNDETRKELITVMKNVVVAQQQNLKTILTDKDFNSRITQLGFTTQKLFPFYNSHFETLPIFKGSSNNSNVGGNINVSNDGIGNQISTETKNSSTNNLLNILNN